MNDIKSKNRNPYHPDILIFLILIPVISAFNYYLTYSNIQLNGFLVLTFSIDTVQGYLAVWGVRAVILLLDQRLPLEQGFLRRISVQLISTLLIGTAIIGILTEMVSWIARGKSAPAHFYTNDLVIISIWFFVVNGIYIGLFFFNEWKRSEALLKRELQLKQEGFIVRQGKQDVRLDFDNIAGFSVDDDYVIAVEFNGKKYYLDQSLDKLEETLPASSFFRLNRQFIVHQKMISGFTRSENGKLTARLISHDNFPAEVSISRLKAPAFKRWFRPSP